jgi:ABC-type Mn2+/Zn2+ transport system ATPase subunit
LSHPAITFEDLTVSLGGRVILDRLNVTVVRGALTAVMGPNGAGKTTLLHAILGLIPYSGRIRFGDHGDKRPRIGYVPQRLDLDRGSPITVRDFLVSVTIRRPIWAGVTRAADRDVQAVLDRVGVKNVLRSPLGKLSGGETQRVLLAQALLGKPEILLLDEPSAAVDVTGGALFCDILEEVQTEMNITTLLVSHDLSVISTHARFVICLNHGIVCSGPVIETLTPENLKKLFSPHVDLFNHSHTHPLPTD